jgi:hypothetical protein
MDGRALAGTSDDVTLGTPTSVTDWGFSNRVAVGTSDGAEVST